MEEKIKGTKMTRQPTIENPTKCIFVLSKLEHQEIKQKAYAKRISIGKWIRRAIHAQLLKERMYE